MMLGCPICTNCSDVHYSECTHIMPVCAHKDCGIAPSILRVVEHKFLKAAVLTFVSYFSLASGVASKAV